MQREQPLLWCYIHFSEHMSALRMSSNLYHRSQCSSVPCFWKDISVLFVLSHHEINELAVNYKNKNIRDVFRGIKEFKNGYHPRNNLVNDVMGICLQIPITF
jgi:hypothetical protein